MNEKRRSIRAKMQIIVLIISMAALLLTSMVGIFSMLRIKENSETALIDQMEQNLNDIVSSKAGLARAELSKYSGYIEDFAAYIHELYVNPSDYVAKEVFPPDAANAGVYSMQRYPVSADIDVASIMEEIGLLGNVEQLWNPVITANSELITTIYIGTESGFHISYDTRADLGVTEGSYESYYDYFDSSWYTGAKEAGKVTFTDTYLDSYGRGLTITCAAPFFDAENEFAGVVCMDILVTDLHAEIININLGQEAKAFLVDSDGDIIAAPDMKLDQEGFENIADENHPARKVVGQILSRKTSIALTDGVYFAFTPITNMDWIFCVQIPAAQILEPVVAMDHNIQLAMVIFIIAFVAIILTVVLLVSRFSKQLTNPLLALKKDVETISGGNLDYRAEIRSNDEIGDLAIGFNNMAESLKNYIEDLTSMTAEKERIGAELDVATHIQSSMLPSVFPAFPDRPEIDIFATMNPAKEVGGDFYDFFMVDDRHLAIVMADVSGKGVPAALFMVIGKTLIKDHTTSSHDLGEVFSQVNNLLCESNSENLFITAFEGVLDLVTGEFEYVNAGHESPYISKAGKSFEQYQIEPDFVLAGFEDMSYTAGKLILEPGDKLFEYTDGVTEATDAHNELYGSERLAEVLDRHADKRPDQILPAVKADIDAFVGTAPQFDDITMLCLEFKNKMELQK